MKLQTIEGRRVFVHYHTAFYRGACIPAAICSLAAGKDAWMREIEFPCACGKFYKAGESETGDFCPACEQEQGEANAKADGAVA